MAGSQFFTMPLGWDKGSQQLLGGGVGKGLESMEQGRREC